MPEFFNSISYVLTYITLPKPNEAAAFGLAVVTRYLFNDWQFLGFLIVLIALDNLTGALVAYRAKTLGTKHVAAFFNRSFVYACLLIVAHVLTHFEVHEVVSIFFKFVDTVIYTMLMGREAVCIVDNITKLDPELLPEPAKARLIQVLVSVPERIITSFLGRALPLDPNEPAAASQSAPIAEPTPDPAPVEAAGQPNPNPS